MNESSDFIRWFSDLGVADVPLVGGKNASLGEMYRELSSHGVRVPNGFATTAAAYRAMLERANAWPRLHAALDGLDASNVTDLARRAKSSTARRCRASWPTRSCRPTANCASSTATS
jgi:pyruvate,water dikinase